MKKDGRFWTLIGALVIVAGLFLVFLWTVMAAPSEPATVNAVANVETTNGSADAATDGKPVDGFAQPMMGDPSTTFAPDNIVADSQARIDEARREAEERMREARAQMDQAQAEAQAAANRAQADARRAAERSRQAAQARERARARARATANDKPPANDGGKPDYW